MRRDHVGATLAALVRRRAKDTCEYCRLPQELQEAVFHIDHIVPRAARGKSTSGNLALACVSCSLRKAARLTVVDPTSIEPVRLYHPRRDAWPEHFRWSRGWRIEGITPIGRATVLALAMNRPAVIAIRRSLAAMGRFPKG